MNANGVSIEKKKTYLKKICGTWRSSNAFSIMKKWPKVNSIMPNNTKGVEST